MKSIDKLTILFVSLVFFGWGISVFFDKLAANRMGSKGTIVYVISMLPSIAVLFFYLFWGYKIFNFDRIGIFWVTAGTILNIIAIIFYYLVFTRAEASWASVITALYPVCTVILAFIFLKETISFYRIIGIVLAMVSIFFLCL